MNAWEIFKSVFCKELFNEPKKENATNRSNVEERCFINKLMKKYVYKFTDIIISGTVSVIRFIKQSCYKKHYDSEFCMCPPQAPRSRPPTSRSPQPPPPPPPPPIRPAAAAAAAASPCRIDYIPN